MTDERSIIQKIKRFDDARCFRMLYEYYISDLYYFVLGYVKSEDSAQDIAQETFATLWKNRKTLDETKSIRGYLFTITYHNIIKEIRRMAKHPALIEYLEMNNEPAVPPEKKLDFISFEKYYSQAKSSLTQRQREIFEMYRETERSVVEISAALGISQQVVRNQLSKANRKLREFFIALSK